MEKYILEAPEFKIQAHNYSRHLLGKEESVTEFLSPCARSIQDTGRYVRKILTSDPHDGGKGSVGDRARRRVEEQKGTP